MSLNGLIFTVQESELFTFTDMYATYWNARILNHQPHNLAVVYIATMIC